MKKALSIILVLTTLVSLIGALSTGCSSASTSKTTSTTATLKEATFKLGVEASLTGPAAPWGLSVDHGYRLAVEDWNAAGGVTIGDTHYTAVVDSLDDKFDPATATTAIRQLVNQDGVKFIQLFQADAGLAMVAELNQEKILQFTTINDDSIIKQPDYSYTFRPFDPYSLQATDFIQWLTQQKPGVKTLSFICTNNANGLAMENIDKTACDSLGLTFLDAVLYDSSTTDFTSFLTKIMAKNPDIISYPGVPTGDAAQITKDLHDLGYTGIEAIGVIGGNDMVGLVGAAACEGAYTLDLAYQAPFVSSVALGLPDREKAEFGSAYCCTWDFYSEATLLLDAIKAADSIDPTEVRDKLHDDTLSWNYAAFTGVKAIFNSSAAQKLYGANAINQLYAPWPICQIQNGSIKIVKMMQPK